MAMSCLSRVSGQIPRLDKILRLFQMNAVFLGVAVEAVDSV
jgi:hypothetical protein